MGPRGPVRGRLARSGGAGAGRGALGFGGVGAGLRSAGLGRTEAAPLLLGALSVGAAHPAVSASPAAAAWRCGRRDTETETAAAGPASGLGLATAPRPPAPSLPVSPRPGFSGSASPRPAGCGALSRRRRPQPPHLGGALARDGRRARAPGRARRQGGSALWGPALEYLEGGAEECGRKKVGGIRFPGLPASCSCLVSANKVTKVACGGFHEDNSL